MKRELLFCPTCRVELDERAGANGDPVWRCPKCTLIIFDRQDAFCEVPMGYTLPEF